MSTQYTTEPPPSATVLLHTTAGPLTISLFASQTPLTCRNFLQHCLDGYYENTVFHRVSPGFVVQTGDPTGTGEGGQNIYEDREFERLDADWAKLLRTDEGEPIKFGNELHSRLKFNRRGLVGMAKGTGDTGGYGSQFFITLGDCRAELDGNCTMFGRVEGDGIYNVVKIAEGEMIEGTERPMYPEKILKVEVVSLPSQDAWQKMQKRERIATRTIESNKTASGGSTKKKAAKKKAGKTLLSFGGEEGDDNDTPMMIMKNKKPKFNTALINGGGTVDVTESTVEVDVDKPTMDKRKTGRLVKEDTTTSDSALKRKADTAPRQSPSPKRRKPSFHDSATQLPIRNPESPSRSPSPQTSSKQASSEHQPKSWRRRSSASSRRLSFTATATSSDTRKEAKPDLAAEIAALKASMRRDTANSTSTTDKKKSALEALIPATSTRGRKRPKHGDSNAKDDEKSLRMLEAFRSRLEGAAAAAATTTATTTASHASSKHKSNKIKLTSNGDDEENNDHDDHDQKAEDEEDQNEDEEAHLCDLHFISNCQSCFSHGDDLDLDSQPVSNNNDNNKNKKDIDVDSDDETSTTSFLTHSLSFAKDRLGKDLNWKRNNEQDLVVIDPRERERELGIVNGRQKKNNINNNNNTKIAK